MKKTKRRRVSSEWDEMEDLISKIPLLNSFAGNPLGTVIAIVLLMMAFLYWDSNAPTNPFVNEPGFQTAVWGNLYTNYNWFLILAVPFFLVGVILQAFREMDDEEKASSIVGSGLRGDGLRGKLFATRPHGLNRRIFPVKTTGPVNVRTIAQPGGAKPVKGINLGPFGPERE